MAKGAASLHVCTVVVIASQAVCDNGVLVVCRRPCHVHLMDAVRFAELRVLKLALHSPLGLFEAHASLQVLKPSLHLALIE